MMKHYVIILLFLVSIVASANEGECKLSQAIPFENNLAELKKDLDVIKSRMELSITPIDSKKFKIRILNRDPLAQNEVYVLESSQDLNTWLPYRIFVATDEIVVPKRFDKEFFRLVKQKLPTASATGKVHATNYTPEHYIFQPDGSRVLVPEKGDFTIHGYFTVNQTELRNFPTAGSLYPPLEMNRKYSPLEAGIVGSIGYIIEPIGTPSFPFKSPTYKTRKEAEDYLANMKFFVSPRHLVLNYE